MRVPRRKMMPRMNRPTEYANHNRLTKPRAMLPKPISNRFKPKTTDAMSAIAPNMTTAFTAADSICATTYSAIDSGVMNMLLKLCDHTFHSAPSDIEYCVMRMISHNSVPRYRYCATVGFITVARKRVTKPNTITVISDQNGRSTITSTERAVMYNSCSSTAPMRSSDTAVAPRDLEEHVFEGWFTDVDVDDLDSRMTDVEDGLRNQVLLGGDDHHVARRQGDFGKATLQRACNDSAVALE